MADNDTTEHDDLLTDEERAAIDADEGEEIDGSASLDGSDTQEWIDNGWGASDMSARSDPPAEDPPADDSTQQAAEDDAAAQQQAADDSQGQPQGDDSSQQQGDDSSQQQQAPVDLTAYDQRLQEFRSKEKELFDQYDDGDLSREEFESQRQELAQQETEIIEQRAIAKQQQADESNRWNSAVNDYFKEYAGLKDDKIISAFDAEVRAVTSNPVLANKSFSEQLEIAHKRLLTTAGDYGLKDVPQLKGQEPDPAPQQQQAQTPARDVRGDDLRNAPPTLARVPASDMTDAGDSQYAALQRIIDNGSPEEAEAAMAQLSPEERDRFASMVV